jgi:hypothetical protein
MLMKPWCWSVCREDESAAFRVETGSPPVQRLLERSIRQMSRVSMAWLALPNYVGKL